MVVLCCRKNYVRISYKMTCPPRARIVCIIFGYMYAPSIPIDAGGAIVSHHLLVKLVAALTGKDDVDWEICRHLTAELKPVTGKRQPETSDGG